MVTGRFSSINPNLISKHNNVSNGDIVPCPQALHYLILISEVEEVEIFKICLEYWSALAAELYRESPFSSSSSPLILGTKPLQEMPARRQLYNPVLSKVSREPHPTPLVLRIKLLQEMQARRDLYISVLSKVSR